MQKLNVLILAAGLGTRLRPLTNDVPKPLVPVVDSCILQLQAVKARAVGDVRLHANAHYLAEQVVAEGERLGFEKVWVEPEILGTAGPLKRIYNEGFRGGLLVMNGDAYCSFDLRGFVANARASGADVALLAVDFPKVNTFRVGADGRLAGIAGRFGSEMGAAATFSGVSWYSDAALARLRDGEFDIREFWKQEMATGNAPFVDMTQLQATWIDMGSPEGLMAAVEARLEELGLDSFDGRDMTSGDGKPVAPEGSACRVGCEDSASLLHSVVHAGVRLPSGVLLDHSVLFAGAEVTAGEKICREIRGRGFAWKLKGESTMDHD